MKCPKCGEENYCKNPYRLCDDCYHQFGVEEIGDLNDD